MQQPKRLVFCLREAGKQAACRGQLLNEVREAASIFHYADKLRMIANEKCQCPLGLWCMVSPWNSLAGVFAVITGQEGVAHWCLAAGNSVACWQTGRTKPRRDALIVAR